MKVPLSWLKEFLSIQRPAHEIAEILTLVGLEVDSIENDVLDIALTPNLAHCASILGVARELSAVIDAPLHMPKFELAEKGIESIESATSVTVENQQGCPRYTCRLIRDLHVAPSPAWLKERLESCGMRSVNNIVDITNYVLLEQGQPLHAFDFDRLEGSALIVRNGHKEEHLAALDGNQYYLSEKDLVICDQKKPVALAGIMDRKTEVSEQGQFYLNRLILILFTSAAQLND